MPGSALLVTLAAFALLALAYVTYGRFLARRVFKLSPHRKTPAHKMEDGVDYVPTRKSILFGHHFASIAGLGPILGPALAVIWGWVPAVIWIVVGCIFMGAVHDLGALTVSLRFRGRSIGDVCRELIGPRARMLFLIIIFFAMSLAMGAFVNAISGFFIKSYPDAIIPSFGLMVVAVGIGIAVYKYKVPLAPATIIGLILFAALIGWGTYQPVPTYDWFVSEETRTALNQARTSPDGDPALPKPWGAAAAMNHFKGKSEQAKNQLKKGGLTESEKSALETEQKTFDGLHADLHKAVGDNQTMGPAQMWWIVALLFYGLLASILPVWLLLQPRDYINSFQLYFALLFLVIGLVVATVIGAPQGQIHAQAFRAPDVDFSTGRFPMMALAIPFLFVTIACGAVSGFHSLVSSGTTVRQMDRETDALPIGYGAMLTEGALAILIVMACVAGLGVGAWTGEGTYTKWVNAPAALGAVVGGGGQLLEQVGMDRRLAATFLSVTIVAFAMTTLDSAVRLLRFNVEEVFRSIGANAFANRYVCSLIAVVGIALFALVPGSRMLWILFGATNQMLAGLALLAVSIFLYKLRRPIIYTLVPMAIMLTVTVVAMIMSLIEFARQGIWPLFGVAIGLLGISLWLLAEAALSFANGPGGLTLEDDEEEESEQLVGGAAE